MLKISKKILLTIGILLVVSFSQDAFAGVPEESVLDIEITNFDGIVSPQCFWCQLENRLVLPGEEFDYLVIVSNNGLTDTNNVSVTMELTGQGVISPANSLDCFADRPNIITCNIGQLLPGESEQLPFSVTVDSDATYGTSFSATASVYAEYGEFFEFIFGLGAILDSAPQIPQSTQALLFPNWGIHNDTPYPGQSYTIMVSVWNKGPAEAQAVVFQYDILGPGVFSEDDLPEDCLTYGPTYIECSIPTLPADGYFDREITILVNENATEGQTFSNSINVLSQTEDPITEDNTTQWDYPQVMIPEIQPTQFDLSVDVGLNTPEVLAGDTFWYSVLVSNDGPDDAEHVSLDVEVSGPGSIDASSMSPQCILNLQNDSMLSCDIGEVLASEASQEISFAVTVDQGAQEGEVFSISANVLYDGTEDVNPTNDSINLSDLFVIPDAFQTHADLLIASALEKSAINSVDPGQKFFQTITVSNHGPNDADLVNIVNSFSGPGDISKADLPQECFVTPTVENQIVCSLGMIENQTSKQVTIIWMIDTDAQKGQKFVNQYSATSSTLDPNDNQSGSFNLEINPPPVIEEIDPAEELQNRIDEQQRIKSLQELEELLSKKLLILNEKKTAYQNSLSNSNDSPEIIIAHQQYLEAKKDYLKVLQQYLDTKLQPTNAELIEFENLLAELKIEYEKFSSEQIVSVIYPKIPEPVIEDFTNIPKPTPIPENEDTKIYELQKAFESSPEQAELYAQSHGIDYESGKIRVIVDLTDEQQMQRLQEAGAIVNSFAGNSVQIEISVSDIENLSGLDFVKNPRLPTIALQNEAKIISEGVPIINADLVQRDGLTGEGVKMAVLDLGFDIENQEIVQNIKENESFRKGFGNSITDMRGHGQDYVHGTAVAEIIVDVAPNVDLYLYSMGTEIEFANAVDYAISNKVNVISMSAGWLNYPTDGSSLMTKKIEEAIESGIVFVVSSGNYATMHWEGKYNDSDGNGWNEFQGQDEALTVQQRKNNNYEMIFYLLWSAESGSISDFDLALIDPNGEQVDYSSNVQNSSGDQLLEYVSFVPDVEGKYSLGVYYDGDKIPDTTLEIFSSTDALEYSVPSGSVAAPTDARGLIVTGAINWKDLELEWFSSQGPTNHGIEVPSVVAPDAVITTAYDGKPFYGTSASAPHVAGIIALMLEKNPSSSPSEIKKLLEINADNSISSSSNRDNMFGYGTVDSGFLIGEEKSGIPEWIKNNAGWWAEGQIDDASFLQGIQFLIKNGIMVIPPTQSGESKSDVVPPWIKNNAGWWAEGQIDDASFLQGIQYLIKEGIITI